MPRSFTARDATPSLLYIVVSEVRQYLAHRATSGIIVLSPGDHLIEIDPSRTRA
jgi:hypothetical protein